MSGSVIRSPGSVSDSLRSPESFRVPDPSTIQYFTVSINVGGLRCLVACS